MTNDTDGCSAPSAGSTSWLCRCGLHKWAVIRSECPEAIRSDIRYAITGRYHGRIETFLRLYDRVCVRCERRDNQIERSTKRIEEEERKVYGVIARATANDPPRPPMPLPAPPRESPNKS